jgi:hypothetical protein
VQEIGRDLDLPVHLWPDKALVNRAESPEHEWLSAWRERQSPEPFAGRETPSTSARNPPPLFTWEEGSGS